MKKPRTKRPPKPDIPEGLTHALFQLVWRLPPVARAVVLPTVVLLIISWGIWLALSDRVKDRALESLTRQLPSVSLGAGKTAGDQVIEVTELCAIEARLARKVLTAGEPTKPREISDYYRHANRKLFEHLDSVAQTYQSNERHVGLTYIMGAPGVGKSFVLRRVRHATTLKLATLFKDHRAELGVEQQPDLAPLAGKRPPFNLLPGLPRDAVLTVDSLLTLVKAGASSPAASGANSRQMIIVDDLDEVHRDTSFLVLRAIDQYIEKRRADESFLHIIVAGRPEAFAEWLVHPQWVPPEGFSKFQLTPPAYITEDARRLFALNYYNTFRKRDSEPAPDAFIRLVDDHEFLAYSIGTLIVGNLVAEQALVKKKQTAEELQRKVYNGLLGRAKDSHKRPTNAPEYEWLLEEIAARYSGHVGGDGRFFVTPNQEIPIADAHGTPIDAVKVRDVLDRSGLAWLDPEDLRTEQGYRFHPFWLHIYLVERRNARVQPGYKYRGCGAAGARTLGSAAESS